MKSLFFVFIGIFAMCNAATIRVISPLVSQPAPVFLPVSSSALVRSAAPVLVTSVELSDWEAYKVTITKIFAMYLFDIKSYKPFFVLILLFFLFNA